MKRPGWIAITLFLAGCQTAAMKDVESFAYRIPSGSRLLLKQDLNIPAGNAHVKFQRGKPVGGVDEYTVNCEFRVRNLGPQSVHPDTFVITDASDGRELISRPYIVRFYKVLRLKSEQQPDVARLTCQQWNEPLMGRNISVPQMREALGEYFVFEFAEQQ